MIFKARGYSHGLFYVAVETRIYKRPDPESSRIWDHIKCNDTIQEAGPTLWDTGTKLRDT